MGLLLDTGTSSPENEESNATKMAAVTCTSEIKNNNKLPCRFL